MNILAVGKTLLQRGDVRHVGEQAQLYLRVIGGDEAASGSGDEGLADASTFLRSDRNILQVRVGGGDAAGGGGGHLEAGVHAPGARIDLPDQRVRVGGF